MSAHHCTGNIIQFFYALEKLKFDEACYGNNQGGKACRGFGATGEVEEVALFAGWA
jgi:hypothetical protein